MSTIPRDPSFTRDGLSLAEWLRRVVSEDQSMRGEAEDVLLAIHHALPSAHTDLKSLDRAPFDFDAHALRFSAAVRSALADASFDTADFIRRLIAIELAGDADWQRYLADKKAYDAPHDAKFERIASKLGDEINTAADESEKEKATRRFARLSRAYICDTKHKAGKPAMPKSLHGGGIRSILFNSFAAESMLASEAIEHLLDNHRQRYHALRLLKQAGPAAMPFVPRLLADIDAAPLPQPSHSPRNMGEESTALAAIARGHAATIDSLITRITSPNSAIQITVMAALRDMAPDLAGRGPIILTLVRPLLEIDEREHVALTTLASVGRDDPATRSLVLDRGKPAAPRMVHPPGFPHYQYDATMAARGAAIESMRYFTAYPNECIPILADAIDTFEEYDPDETYHGPVARVARILQLFGPSAAPAVPRLAAHLTDPDYDFPKAILRALAAVGPGAESALPALRAFRTPPGDPPAFPPPNPNEDLVGWTIHKITTPQA